MSDKKNHVRLTQLPLHPRSIAESMQVPERVVQEDRMTQPEWAMGKAGLQQLANDLGCDPSDILHMKRARSPGPSINSMLD